MKLYAYWRSSSSYRLRIALNLKGVAYDTHPIHLVRDGGDQYSAAFMALNPQGRVPVLVTDDGHALTQSTAIMEWLEETRPAPALLPTDPLDRARVRAFVQTIAADVQPLHNSGVLFALSDQFGADKAALSVWIGRWIARACEALEADAEARRSPEPYMFGGAIGWAEVALLPHLYTARRWGLPLDAYPRLLAAEAAALAVPAVAAAHPDRQPDVEA